MKAVIAEILSPLSVTTSTEWAVQVEPSRVVVAEGELAAAGRGRN